MSTPPLDVQRLIEAETPYPVDLIEEHINPTFTKVLRMLGYDVTYTRGVGAYLYDTRGNRYIDCLSGFGQFALGRNHPVVRDALKQAMDLDLPGLPKFGAPRLSGLLAKKLLAIAPGELDTVYFCNSGAEGAETAIKYARAATGRTRIIYLNKSYHGLTTGALAATAPEFQDGFGPMTPGFTAVPMNDPDALAYELAKGDVAGFMFEPIQGKGVFLPDEGYLTEAAALCRKHGALLIADEVQTGLGRTGRMFACEHWGIEPDLLILSKALSGGYVPVGAVLSKRWIHDKVFSSLDRCVVHSTTFGQGDLAMTAGLATLHVLEHERLVERARDVGDYLLGRLRAMTQKYELVRDVRGKGLMIAIAFGPPRSLKLKLGWSLLHKVDAGLFPQAVLMPLFKQHHVLAQVAGHHMDVIKLIPPLVLSREDADAIVDAFDATIGACHRFPGPAWEIGKNLAQQVRRRHDVAEPAGV